MAIDNHMAIDQHGQTFHNLGLHPRQALLHRLDRQHADKMYCDSTRGTHHVGYIIAGLWLTVYTVTQWEKKA